MTFEAGILTLQDIASQCFCKRIDVGERIEVCLFPHDKDVSKRRVVELTDRGTFEMRFEVCTEFLEVEI